MEVLFWDKVLEKSIVHMNVKSCIKTPSPFCYVVLYWGEYENLAVYDI